MPAEGQHKRDLNFVAHRAKSQTAFWSKLVKGEIDGLDVSDVDQEILECCIEGKYFRGEGHTTNADGRGAEKTPMEELWLLYIGVETISDEEEQRGKKKSKDTAVIPIKARRIMGYEVLDEKGLVTDEISYDRIQYLDKKGRPTGVDNIFEPLHFHDDGYLDFPAWLHARDQCRKDLFFLNTMVLGNTKMTRKVHQKICDLFTQKNFDNVYRRGYGLNVLLNAISRQNRVPTRWDPKTKNYVHIPEELDHLDNYQRMALLLFSRAFFKSTISRADAVQWMLACPDISMMIMTGSLPLAEEFVLEIKKQFFLPKGGTLKPLHLLFPEYILRGVDGTSAEDLVCPARRVDRTYPTLWADSIDSVSSGWHCDVEKFDDVVSNANGRTEITRVKLKNSIDNLINLCDTWGKIDMIGTRYFVDDYYGERIKVYETAKEDEEDSDTVGLKYFVGAAWTVKLEFKHIAEKNLRDLKEHMVELAFPEHATFKYLRGLLLNNEQEFRCQQLNEPAWGADEVDMPMSLLVSHQMSPVEAKSLRGDVVIVGDLAKEVTKSADYTCFAAMKVFRAKNSENGAQDGTVSVVVLEVVYGRWSQQKMAEELAKLNERWLPGKIHVEDTGGLESFWMYAVPEAFKRTQSPYYYHIFRAKVEQGYGAKKNRVKGIEVLLKSDRMWFAMGPWNNEAFAQISQYTGAKSTRSRKDDIPDALSFISKYLPSSTPKSPEQVQQDLQQEEYELGQRILMAQHEAMFGRTYNINQRETQEPIQPKETPGSSIANRLFGNNGLRG